MIKFCFRSIYYEKNSDFLILKFFFLLVVRSFSNKLTYLPSYRIFHLTATSFLTSDLSSFVDPEATLVKRDFRLHLKVS